jgi:cysteine desulfurase
MKHKLIYADYAATTPVDKRVVRAMLPYFDRKYGNPASMHRMGQENLEVLNKCRKIAADFIGAKEEEIIFTGSASESNNFALKGVMWANRNKGNHLIVSSVEHDCVLESARWLSKNGFEVTYLPVDEYGMVDPKNVEKAIKKNTVLVSVMQANNEIGTINPVEEIAKICHKHGVLFHTDAAQTCGKIDVNVQKIGADLLTASSHKMYGPKGAAMLYIKKETKIETWMHGGGQEGGMRSSTVNIPAIVGFVSAIEIAKKEMKTESIRLIKLREKLIKKILSTIPTAKLNGHSEKRLPNNVSFRFAYIEGESIVYWLNEYGIMASTGSACSSPKLTPSHVLTACGLKKEEIHGSLRLSLGKETTEKDIDYIIEKLQIVVKKLNKLSPFID